MRRAVALSGVCLTLTACGAGSGGQSPQSIPAPAPVAAAPATPAPVAATAASLAPAATSASVNDTPEFRQNAAAYSRVGLLAAHDLGLTGRGVTVGIVDDGLDTASAEFAGRVSALSRDFGHDERLTDKGDYVGVERSGLAGPYTDHGMEVASVIAAARDGRGTVGVAPEASVAVLRADISRPGNNTEYFPDTSVAAAIGYAADQHIALLNISLSRVGRSEPLIAAAARYAATGGLIVFAAGNNGSADPDIAANIDSANRGATIFVGGLAASGDSLDPRSNRAGSLADRFLVAPMEVTTLQPGGGTALSAGTSFSAPLVAGAAALLLERWPQLTGAQAGEILLATARDLGAPGTDAVFGRGLLDIAAAATPLDPVIATPQRASSVAAATVMLPQAFGPTGVRRALDGAVITDRFGRDFSVALGRRVSAAPVLASLGSAVQASDAAGFAVPGLTGSFAWRGDGRSADGAPRMRLSEVRIAGRTGGVAWSFTQGGDPGAAVAAPLAAAQGGFAGYAPQAGRHIGIASGRFALQLSQGSTRDGAVSGASLSWRKDGLMLRASAIAEHGTLFGQSSAGALRVADAATTVAVEARKGWSLSPRWSAVVDGGIGRTRLEAARASLFGAAGPLLASHFAAELRGDLGASQIIFSLAQPLTVEHGRATLLVPARYDLASRSVETERRDVSLAADERTLLLSAGYSRTLGAAGRFSLSATRDLGRGGTAALASLRSRF